MDRKRRGWLEQTAATIVRAPRARPERGSWGPGSWQKDNAGDRENQGAGAVAPRGMRGTEPGGRLRGRTGWQATSGTTRGGRLMAKVLFRPKVCGAIVRLRRTALRGDLLALSVDRPGTTMRRRGDRSVLQKNFRGDILGGGL